MAWWNRKNNAAPGAPALPKDNDPGEPDEPITGPIPRQPRTPGGWRWPRFSGMTGAKMEGPEDWQHLPAFERQRKIVESFQEDALELTDKIKLKAAKVASILLPIIAVYAIGGELGQYFAGGAAFSWTSDFVRNQYLIAYAGEFTLAVLTYVLGYAAGQKSGGTGHVVKLLITFTVWILFLAASAVGQWFVTLSVLHPDAQAQVALGIRIAMCCSLDIAAVCLMWWRGKSLAKFLEQQAKKAESIRAVNESELSIQAAQDAAERRRREDEQYQRAKDMHNAMVVKIQELQTAALVKQAEQSLLNQPAGGARDRSNW